LHEEGCPWDNETTYFAVYSENLEIFNYAYKNGCPCDNKTLKIAKEKGYIQ
jgi:hypothetical protein